MALTPLGEDPALAALMQERTMAVPRLLAESFEAELGNRVSPPDFKRFGVLRSAITQELMDSRTADGTPAKPDVTLHIDEAADLVEFLGRYHPGSERHAHFSGELGRLTGQGSGITVIGV